MILQCAHINRSLSLYWNHKNIISIFFGCAVWMKPDPNNLKPITNRFSVNESRHLGKGCFGNVYQGYDHGSGKVIAVKHLNQPENFKGEIETLQKLSTLVHPNIMGFYGYKVDAKDVYLFVQYCPGGVLTDHIKKGIPEQQVLDLFRQLVEGMCYLNAKQIMHRDLKPDNILMGSSKDIKISDFGLARVEDGLEKTGQTGTPLYAGPEIYTNYIDSYNYNCDVWSAGLILHQMLTGHHPFEQISTVPELKQQWKMFEKGEKRISYPKNIHPQWEYITNIMLTHNFKKRPMFHDILELLKKLDDNGTMRKQIRNSSKGIKSEQNSKQATLERYLSFIEHKTDIIVELTQQLTPERCPFIKPSLQWLLLFTSVTWYTIKVKNLVRSLKFKNLKYPDKTDVIDRKNPDDKNNLIMDKFRNVFEVKLTKYQNFLKERILPKMQEQQAKPEQLKLFKSLQSAYKLYLEAKEGSYDVQQTYQQQYTRVLSFHKLKPTEQKITHMTDVEVQCYAIVLLIGFLNEELPDAGFRETAVGARLAAIRDMSRGDINAYVNKMRARLK